MAYTVHKVCYFRFAKSNFLRFTTQFINRSICTQHSQHHFGQQQACRIGRTAMFRSNFSFLPVQNYSSVKSSSSTLQSSINYVSPEGPFACLSSDILVLLNSYKAAVLKEYTELSQLLSESASLGNSLSSESIIQATKRWQQLSPIGEVLVDLDRLKLAHLETESILKELVGYEDSSELGELAEIEAVERAKEQLELEKKLYCYLVPPEEYDDHDVTLDIESGAGGQEAMLFADELLSMYLKYADLKGWTYSITDIERSENLGGIRSASVVLRGNNIHHELKYEGGVHRVQRVPVTGKGKIHTSTVAVAVFPLVESIDIEIDPSELKIETFRSSGPGGQHVNKTESAVRLTHLPTNTVATCQDDRCQHANKATALDRLKQKLMKQQTEKKLAKENENRKIQFGGRDRSEKIRTYNYSQDRITDHRISKSFNGIERFMILTKGLSDAIESLKHYANTERLEQTLKNFINKSE